MKARLNYSEVAPNAIKGMLELEKICTWFRARTPALRVGKNQGFTNQRMRLLH